MADTTRPSGQATPAPHPALRALDPLAGTWQLHGRIAESGDELVGRLRREWMDGGFYLVQQVDLDYGGTPVTGTEYVGHDAEGGLLRSYFFSSDGPGPFGGVAMEYVWEIAGRDVTIWGGFVGSPANWRGTLSDDGRVMTGRWEWPGGGYEATLTRVEDL
jgi:hypothetical protein